MFLGKYRLFFVAEHTLNLPGAFREMLSQGLYVTRGFERNLLIMNETSFRAKYDRLVSLNIADPTARLLMRLMLANAVRLEMDALGQIALPAELTGFAGLEKEVVLVGQGNYIEAWSPAEWEKQSISLKDLDFTNPRFAALDLSFT
jgi:MraZ protein